ncbi:hypothetical protein CLOM_g20117 [Closterium sp. NIES-68]|nr:hypothetical protein CLOM_g20117 [Closterium sp. NIES-68]GJP64134.1 hypothetical protein CLOP_g21155 [Closterium sp. NIES-67]
MASVTLGMAACAPALRCKPTSSATCVSSGEALAEARLGAHKSALRIHSSGNAAAQWNPLSSSRSRSACRFAAPCSSQGVASRRRAAWRVQASASEPPSDAKSDATSASSESSDISSGVSTPGVTSEQYQMLLDPRASEGACDPLCSIDEMSYEEYEEVQGQEKSDNIKALVLAATIAIGAAAINLEWVEAHQDITMWAVFVLGYAGIIFEESLAFNKAGVGLLMAVALWVIRDVCAPAQGLAVAELSHHCGEVAEIVFFLWGAMTIVEIVDAHQGFKLVTDAIQTRNSKKLLWMVGGITFFLSSILDNLTSTIVMVSLLRKLVPDPERRRFLGAVVVIAANSGGAWTPIGDVTTTMLWIHGQISTVKTITDLFFPSLVSLAVPLALLSFDKSLVGDSDKAAAAKSTFANEAMAPRGRLVFGVGIGSLIFVPVFKALTGLPPYLGMLAGLGALWLLTDAIHYGESDRQRLKVPQALSRIDTQGILFFLGILLSVGSLEAAGLLKDLAGWLDSSVGSVELIAGTIGLASAVIDNVPLVAATMGMYDLSTFPADAELWQLIAYCAGTGGSILIIGSAAGVAYMGMEKTDFFWYLRKVSGVALAGYVAGMATYLAGAYVPNDLFATTLAALPQLPQLPF